MTDLLDLLAEAEALRDVAFTHLDAADSNDENALLREQITALGRRLDVFSANDVPQWVRERTTPNRRGRMFRQLAEEGVLRVVGMTKSANPRAHGKGVWTYELAGSDHA